ncbi:MAG: hypothetical protein A3D92_03995 [Bacteroidetes bacterium RIFCSPHIGHO2_02_FULL_44_7]|nr:MAG: hypothetical protein A3D92_03995 [Bacteroidetes bacterium RIFCSPHIGHO2_02_FULL_44_7]
MVDQMCYEYLYRYADKFGEGGFKRLMQEGTNCRNANYNYIPTFTGPGHASIYTGTTPSNHGIVANDWYDRSTNSEINCVADSGVSTVGSSSLYGKCSPVNLKTNTITDQLKVTYNSAKVVSVSIKNRGAILPGGHLSDGSYWFDYSSGGMITSSYFKKELPSWVNAFNDLQYPKKSCNEVWNTYYPIGQYSESGPDDTPYEHLLPGKMAPTFPYDLKTMTGGMANYDLFTTTPYANTYLTDFALAAIQHEQLGADAQADMLCISYSTPDIAGHAFGPQSIEIEDMYIRLDLEIERLLKELETRVGKREFVLFLTADHAVVPVPQFLIDHKLPGGYFFLGKHMSELKQYSIERYGVDLIEEEANLNIYLNRALIEEQKLSLEEVATQFAQVIQQWEGVKRVFTSTQLYQSAADEEWMDMVRKGYHHSESGDIIFMLEPGYLPKSADSEQARKGTSHGSAYSYDTHVPLLWYGANVPAQDLYRNVAITDITATLTHILNLQNLGALTGEPILELLKK